MAMNKMAIELVVSLKWWCFFLICVTSRALDNFSGASQQEVIPIVNSLWLQSWSSSKKPFRASPGYVNMFHLSVIMT